VERVNSKCEYDDSFNLKYTDIFSRVENVLKFTHIDNRLGHIRCVQCLLCM
jgi:hypothetical protein